MSIGIKQQLKLFYLLSNLATFVSIGHQQTSAAHLNNLRSALNSATRSYRLCSICKRFMLNKFETLGVIHKSIASNARFLMIRFTETAVYDH